MHCCTLLSVLVFASISICCVSPCLLNAGVWMWMGQKKHNFSGKLDKIWEKNQQYTSEWRILSAVFIMIRNTCLPLRNQQLVPLLLSGQSWYLRWSKGFGELFICLKHCLDALEESFLYCCDHDQKKSLVPINQFEHPMLSLLMQSWLCWKDNDEHYSWYSRAVILVWGGMWALLRNM